MKTFNTKIITAAVTLISAGSLLFVCENALAGSYGTDITIYDGTLNDGDGTAKEDNEAEHNMVQSQAWDLEGFLLNGKALTIVGGYNFYTGQEEMMAGDIFIDTNGDAVVSPNIIGGGFTYTADQIVSNGFFKYDYVLDINWTAGTFDIVELNGNSSLKNTTYGSTWNMPSNPWTYITGGDVIQSLSFTNYGKASRTDTDFLGWDNDTNHYAATFDLTSLDLSNGALFHNTMQCGNDNMLGKTASVPEPSILLLFGTGLAGFAAVRRKK